MGELSLSKMALEILQINEEFVFRAGAPVKNYELITFQQWWGSTTGGFGGIGGSAMTQMRTYVFVNIKSCVDCVVFFGGRYAYTVRRTDKFLADVLKSDVRGVWECDCYDVINKVGGSY